MLELVKHRSLNSYEECTVLYFSRFTAELAVVWLCVCVCVFGVHQVPRWEPQQEFTAPRQLLQLPERLPVLSPQHLQVPRQVDSWTPAHADPNSRIWFCHAQTCTAPLTKLSPWRPPVSLLHLLSSLWRQIGIKLWLLTMSYENSLRMIARCLSVYWASNASFWTDFTK